MWANLRVASSAAVFLWLAGCARPELTPKLIAEHKAEALTMASSPTVVDDLDLEPLFKAVETEILYMESATGRFENFDFGSAQYSKAEYMAGLRRFVELGRAAKSKEEFFKQVEKEFQFFEVYGGRGQGEAFFTSYYEPVVKGSRRKTKTFIQPIYKQPSDLIYFDPADFDEKYKGDRKLRGRLLKPGEPGNTERAANGNGNGNGNGGARTRPPLTGPIPRLVPYFSRDDIDNKEALKNRKLELVWLDPFDAYLIQVQGSGTVEFADGTHVRIGYSEKNGWKFQGLSKQLKDKIPEDKMNLHSMEFYLRGLPVDEMRKILFTDPSYVFFREIDANAITSLGVPATDGRTVATDSRFFPKGALAFIMGQKPVFEGPVPANPKDRRPEQFEPKEWISFSRFVLDQDIGGAIVGGGRADIFWGKGDEAKRVAGLMKQWGRMYYLAPKKATK